MWKEMCDPYTFVWRNASAQKPDWIVYRRAPSRARLTRARNGAGASVLPSRSRASGYMNSAMIKSLLPPPLSPAHSSSSDDMGRSAEW
jgi:hypothetical protein